MPKAISCMSLLLCLFIQASHAHATSSKRPLNLLIWEDFLDEQVIEQWERETGIPIKQTYYDDEAQRNLVLSSSSKSNFDLVIVDQTSINVLGQAGYIYPVEPSYKPQYWQESCGVYGRAYAWGTYGIGYRTDKLSNPINSWGDLMFPKNNLRGHISMLGQADELITSALASLEYPISASDEPSLREAFKLLKQQSSFVVTYDYIYSYIVENPESDEVWVAPMYSGDHEGLNEIQGIDSWTYVIPEEGAIVWMDCLAIVASSGKKSEAQDFIDFLSREDITALNTEALGVATPFIDAVALQNEDFQSNRNVYLQDETLEKAMLFAPLAGDDMLKRIRIKDALIRYYDSN